MPRHCLRRHPRRIPRFSKSESLWRDTVRYSASEGASSQALWRAAEPHAPHRSAWRQRESESNLQIADPREP